MRVNPPLPTRLGLIARSTGVLLGLLAIALALLQPSALPWLPLTGGLGLVGTGLLVLGWPSGRQARRQPMLAFMDTIAQLPGDLWKPTQQLWRWHLAHHAQNDADEARPAPTSPQAKARIQQLLRDAQDTEPMARDEGPRTAHTAPAAHLTSAHDTFAAHEQATPAAPSAPAPAAFPGSPALPLPAAAQPLVQPDPLTQRAHPTEPLPAALVPQPPAPQPPLTRATPQRRWEPQVLQVIEWHRLVTVVANLFVQVGFRPRRFHPVGRSGADVWLQSGKSGPSGTSGTSGASGASDKGQLLLRCVASRAGIGASDIDAFARSLQAQALAHGTFATNGQFSPQARQRAAELHIHTLDGEQLLKLIAARTPEQQDRLLQTAYVGAYWRPTCVRCGIKLVERVRAQDRRPYWGCRNAPDCDVVLPLDMAQLSRSR